MSIEMEAPRTVEQRKKAAESACAGIEKIHGKGAIFNMASRVGVEWPSIPTGIFGLDYDVLGIGGLPRGRIIEIYGPESGGKTTLALRAIAQAQEKKELCAFIDAEHALDPNWATKLGVRMDDLYVAQPDNGEQALEIAESLIESQAFAIIVIDSVAALVPKSELEGDIEDSSMGTQARMMSKALRMLNAKVAKSGAIVIFINQIRDKIGVMFGSPETTTGGKALKFYASVRLDIRKISVEKDGDEIIGNLVRIKGVKNKMSRPFRETQAVLYFDSGFNGVESLFNTAVAQGAIKQSGSWFEYEGEKLGQGQDKAVLSIQQSSKLREAIEKATKEKLRGTESV